MGRNESILNRNFTDNDISEEEWIDHFENENQNQNQNAHILTREETVDGIRDEGYDDTIDAVIREVDVKKKLSYTSKAARQPDQMVYHRQIKDSCERNGTILKIKIL